MKQDPFKTNIDGRIEFMLRTARSYENMEPLALVGKVAEETGELAAAVNTMLGYMPHKQLKDTPYEEAADIINVLTGLLVKLYPNDSIDVIKKNLDTALQKKGDKYVSIVGPEK